MSASSQVKGMPLRGLRSLWRGPFLVLRVAGGGYQNCRWWVGASGWGPPSVSARSQVAGMPLRETEVTRGPFLVLRVESGGYQGERWTN